MVQIVAAEKGDWANWLPLWQDYLTFYKQSLSDDITRLTFERALDDGVPLYLLLAKSESIAPSENEILGFSFFVLHPSTWARSGYCYLEDLFVADAARGQGVGRNLIEAVAASAKTLGAERLYWVTDASNTKAQSLYATLAEKTDFIQYRREIP